MKTTKCTCIVNYREYFDGEMSFFTSHKAMKASFLWVVTCWVLFLMNSELKQIAVREPLLMCFDLILPRQGSGRSAYTWLALAMAVLRLRPSLL